MFSSIKNVLLILLIFVNPTDAMLKGKLSKNLRKMKIAGLVVGAVVKMKKLVDSHPPGDKNTVDPTCTEATSTAALAMDAFNLKRKTNGLPAYSIKKIVSYQTQLVAGKLHIFCIETVEDGYVQLTWDDVAFGEPHLVLVNPLNKVFAWVGGSPASEFMCSVLPLPLDPREDTSAARFRFRETKTSISTSLLETSNGITELPKSWDARVDHPRSPQCKELINKVHSQGTCGSCYAFAALGTASIRACIAGHEVKNNWYSVQDVLNCGSDREGSFQNAVKDGAKGTTFAGNCAGHWAGNVFEYAVKYGLVDPHCQKYAHGGDPLTHFDKGAGSKICILTNNGKSPVTPGFDLFTPQSEDYINFLAELKKVVDSKDMVPTSEQYKELQRLSENKHGDDAAVLSLMRQENNKAWKDYLLTPKGSKMTKMTFNEPIKPGDSVTVDNEEWCQKYGDEWNKKYTTNMEEIKASKQSPDYRQNQAHCLAYKRDKDAMTVTCKTNADVSVELNGPAGSTTGGLDMAICKCAGENREFKQNGKSVDIDEKAVQFSELGNHARGTCLREKDGTFDEKHKVEGCVPDKIFHSPVKVRGDTQSELIMMKAIQEGGAIAVSFATTPSFMAFDGKGVWDIKEGESIDGGHAILFFGWGEEDGKKFWWGKNSWGAKSPAAIFKFARGTDAANIESMGADWLSVSPPGVKNEQSVALPTKANGFCPDSLLHESLLADPTKMDNACVSVECDGEGKCNIIWGPTCPKQSTEATVVEIVSDSNYISLPNWGERTFSLDMYTVCISNIYTADRSGKKAEL